MELKDPHRPSPVSEASLHSEGTVDGAGGKMGQEAKERAAAPTGRERAKAMSEWK